MLRQDIQGLRAIAVLSIVIFHAFPAALPGGFVGVDIFFVISGFLITSIILRDIDAARFSIAGFYRRRIRRIFPALYAMLTICFIAGLWLMSPLQMQELARNTLSTILFVSNIDFYLLTGYFDGAADLKPLLHTWSLSVEEQFYILFPPVTYLLWTHARKYTALIMAAGFILSLLGAEYLRFKAPSAAFYMMPARGFELLSGAILALGAIRPPGTARGRELAATAGLVLISLAILLYSRQTPFPGVTALVPCLGTALVILAGQQHTPRTTSLITSATFRLIGDMSYSLYLWHWPILAFARLSYGEHLPLPVAGAGFALSFVAGYLSHRFIEQPFLHERMRDWPFLKVGLGMIGITALIFAGIYRSGGLPIRFSPEALAYFASSGDFNPERPRCHNNGGPAHAFASHCVFGATGIRPDTVVWGDSHGAELAVVLGHAASVKGRSIMQITSSACPPALDFAVKDRPHCIASNRDTMHALRETASIANVILAINPPRYDDQAALHAGLTASVHTLHSAGKRVIILGEIPIMPLDPPAALGLAIARGQSVESLGLPNAPFESASSAMRRFYHQLAHDHGAEFFDPATQLCKAALCRIAHPEMRGSLYFNADHLSMSGIAFAAKPLIDNLYR